MAAFWQECEVSVPNKPVPVPRTLLFTQQAKENNNKPNEEGQRINIEKAIQFMRVESTNSGESTETSCEARSRSSSQDQQQQQESKTKTTTTTTNSFSECGLLGDEEDCRAGAGVAMAF